MTPTTCIILFLFAGFIAVVTFTFRGKGSLAALAYDPPIIRHGSDRYDGPTGNWYIVHQHSPTGSTIHLSGHLTRAGAEREVAASKKHLPWAAEGEWIIKPTSEYGSTE